MSNVWNNDTKPVIEPTPVPEKPLSMLNIIIIVSIIFAIFYYISNMNKTCTEYHFKDKVKIIKGFYKGHTGTVINVQDGCVYNVQVDGVERLRDISGNDIELVK